MIDARSAPVRISRSEGCHGTPSTTGPSDHISVPIRPKTYGTRRAGHASIVPGSGPTLNTPTAGAAAGGCGWRNGASIPVRIATGGPAVGPYFGPHALEIRGIVASGHEQWYHALAPDHVANPPWECCSPGVYRAHIRWGVSPSVYGKSANIMVAGPSSSNVLWRNEQQPA